MDVNSVTRTAAILYADGTQNVNQKTIIRKIIESVFVRIDNKELTLHQLLVEIHNDLSLEFSEDEISKIINDSKKFEIRYLTNSKDALIRLNGQRFSTVKEKEEKNLIENYIKFFAEKIYKGGLSEESIMDCFNRYIYELLNKNISAFKKITKASESTGEISIDANLFSLEERDCINGFLKWNNSEKNKALFDVVSYAIEYALITNNVTGGHIFSENIKNKMFYFDINVIYRAIGINGEDRRNITLSFLNKCKNTGQKFFISKFSIDEFKESIQYHIKQLERVPFNKINPKIFSEYAINTSFYEFYHRWRFNRTSAYGFDLFHAHVISLYKDFLKDFNVTEDFKTPFNENDKDVIKKVDDYSEEIRVYSGKNLRTARYDAFNIFLIEKRRGDNSRNITDTKFFFVSVDQRLRNWDFQRNDLQPIALLPSQWMSILLKYFSRSSDDYKSFISFLQLRLQEPVIQEEELHFVLSGISEVTEDFTNQKRIFDTMVELKFQKIIEGKDADEIKQEAVKFAKNLMDDKIADIKRQYANEKTDLHKSLAKTKLEHKKLLLAEQQDSLNNLNSNKDTIEEKVQSKINKIKFFISGYYVFVGAVALSLLSYFGWNFMEPLVYIITVFLVVIQKVYLIIKGDNWDLREFIPKLREKYYIEECKKFGYSEVRRNYLSENIPKLKQEIEDLQGKIKDS